MYKRRALIFIGCALAVLLPIFGLTAYYSFSDPLHLFYSGEKKSIQEKSMLLPNMRLQARGIMNLYDFDSVMLCTSIFENTSSEYASRQLGGKFANLSISGGSFYERSFILDRVLKQKKIKKVIYSLDFYYLKNLMFKMSADFAHLYTGNQFDMAMIYNSKDFAKMFFTGKELRRYVTPDEMINWMVEYHACRFGGLRNWVVNIEKQGISQFLYEDVPYVIHKLENKTEPETDSLEAICSVFNRDIVNFIKNNPETEFYLFFPPYWRYVFAAWKQSSIKDYEIHKDVVRYFVHLSEKYDNLKIFGFETENFVDDIANYKDTTHYHPDINEYMVRCFKNGKNMLTAENVEEYLTKSEKLAEDFDFAGFAREANKILKENNMSLIQY